MKHPFYIFVLIISLFSFVQVKAESRSMVKSTKQERNYINDGNKQYAAQRFADAEILYRKALEANPLSEYAGYNLATSLLRQAGTTDKNNNNTPLAEAKSILENLVQTAKTELIVEKASYNLGNIAYNNNDFQSSIEYYKNALRHNSSNDKARQNLRIAQKRLEQQQQQQQNQNQDQNKEQEKQKDQQKDQQNKDKDQQNNNKQDQNKDKKNDEQYNPQPQNGISDANAEKILKAMEDEEAATRKKIEAQRKKMGQAQRRQPVKPW